MTTKICRDGGTRLAVKLTGRPPKDRTYFRIAGPSFPIFRVHNNNLTNLKRGLVERVFRVEVNGMLVPTPKPAPYHFWNALLPFKNAFRKHRPYAAKVATEDFVGSYLGRRRTVYAEAAQSLLTFGVKRRHAYLDTFVKCEKVNFSSKLDPAPRVIQPRNPIYNVAVGVFLKFLEKPIYRAIADVWGGPTVLKGYNASGTARELRQMWESFKKPVAVGIDASRFDQHFSFDALSWEHMIYLMCFHGSDREELRQLLEWQLVNKGFAKASDGTIRYKIEGCRMSGDMNTAMGNCLVMSAMVYCYCLSVGVTARLANNGDDCVVIFESSSLNKFTSKLSEWFLAMGFNMKVEEPVFEFERIEFCQTKPIWTPDGWLMCRNPHVCLAKDLVSTLPMDMPGISHGWATAIGECGMSLCGGVPIMQEFYSSLIRSGRGQRIGAHPALESGFARLSIGMSRAYTSIHWATRYSFWRAFGISPMEQIAIEDWFIREPINLDPGPREFVDQLFPNTLLSPKW